MIDQIFEKRPKRKVIDLNIVPILDMLVTVIFFLLLSTTFLEYVKLTVPPSAVASVLGDDERKPVSPKFFVKKSGEELNLSLQWAGSTPGVRSARAVASDRGSVIEKSRSLVDEFAKSYPSEKTVQLGLGAEVPYQNLVSVMDGIRPALPDVVLVHYREAEAGGVR